LPIAGASFIDGFDADVGIKYPRSYPRTYFGTRYVFGVHQIKQEDEQRRAVLSRKVSPLLS
jgi:hypothetical protein